MSDALTGIQDLTASMKLDRLLKQKFKNDEVALDKAVEEATLRAHKRLEEFSKLMNGGMSVQLGALRADLGEDMWRSLPPGTNLRDLLDRWMREKANKAAVILVEEYRTLLPENNDITDSELIGALSFKGF